jgi:DNA-directed RNA polymerase specialized sigma24 family protein
VGLIRLAYLMLGDRPSAEDAVQDAFCGLYRQREALVLRFYLDLPEREIARIMGLRPGSVRSATHRALKTLGQSLEKRS